MWNSAVEPDVELGICQPSQRIDGAGTGASRERPTPPPHQDVELGFFSDSLFHDSGHDLGGVSDGLGALSQHTHTHTSTAWEEQARNTEFSKPNGTDWRKEEEERQRWSLDSGRRETMDTPILRSEGGKLLFTTDTAPNLLLTQYLLSCYYCRLRRAVVLAYEGAP